MSAEVPHWVDPKERSHRRALSISLSIWRASDSDEVEGRIVIEEVLMLQLFFLRVGARLLERKRSRMEMAGLSAEQESRRDEKVNGRGDAEEGVVGRKLIDLRLF